MTINSKKSYIYERWNYYGVCTSYFLGIHTGRPVHIYGNYSMESVCDSVSFKKGISNFSKKGRSISSSMYFSRKIIHFLAGGLTAILLPFAVHESIIPAATVFGLALITYLPHKLNRRMYWFQDQIRAYIFFQNIAFKIYLNPRVT